VLHGFIKFITFVCLTASIAALRVGATVVFTNNFDGALPPEINPGAAALTGVQGYAGLGPVGNQFGGSFLRSPTGNTITLTLSNLPPHNVLNLSMLFAAIDSLDGTGNVPPTGDFFKVTVGTNVVFRESFANADPGQIQSYVAPPGGELARHVDLGFSGPGSYYTDSAYNFGVDSRFSGLAHTGATATLTFLIEGPGIQDLNDESWAMDNLGVSVTTVTQPVITKILPVETNVIITWSAVPTFTYRMQSKSNLLDAAWDNLVPLVTATNSTADYTDQRGSGNKFYRVMVVP
jgi:hypothetical protein